MRSKPWRKNSSPKKVLAIRFQALGDTVITLPYLNDFKTQHPQVQLHFFTRKEVDVIPRGLKLFDKVISLGGGRNAKLIFVLMLLRLPYLWLEGYDVVLDLQNNRISRIARMLLFPAAWAEFDKESPHSAGSRTKHTIDAVGLGKVGVNGSFKFKVPHQLKLAGQFLKIILNPAGYASSRNWPIENYIAFAKQCITSFPREIKFVLLLTGRDAEKARRIKQELADHCVDFTGQANQLEAFKIINECDLMLTEDSGLMHMAWVQGVPTISLFSSSRKDWSAPQGPKSICLDSSDLPCGPCQLEVCKYGDNHCLTRYTPSAIVEYARQLLPLV